MSKRIVIGLDGSEFTGAAIDLGIRMAKQQDGILVGVGIIDMPGIEEAYRGATPGAMHYATEVVEYRIRDANQKVTGFLKSFETRCRDAEVRCELSSLVGAPFQQLIDEGKVADLIIVGIRNYFHFETSSKPGDTLKRLLDTPVCPVVAVPAPLEMPERVIIAYDGSVQASRAMRVFCQLFRGSPCMTDVRLITITEDTEAGQKDLESAARYLRGNNIEPQLLLEVSSNPKRVLREKVEGLQPVMVVMGAFSRSSIVEFFVGSTAQAIIDYGKVPLFVYH